MTDPNELIVQLIGCLPMIDEGPDHKLWCSVRGDWLRAAVAALTPAPAQPEPPTAAGVRTDGAPAEIWLQLHGDGEPDGNPVDYRDEVSWCWEKINEHDVRYVLADAKPEPPPAGVEPRLQGGMDNDELLEAWNRKLPGVIPTDAELRAFALGVEVGDLPSRTYFLERNSARDAWRARVKQCEELQAALATPPTLTDAQCDATKDAERYRWLRQFSYPLDGILEVLTTSTDDQPPTHLYGDYLDAAIDRALIRAAAAGAGS